METALLGGESSGGSRRRVIHGRSDAIAYGDPYQKAAALVDLAEDGIGLPEELLDQANFGSKAKYYFMFIRFDVVWTLNYFAMILLNFLEKPLWCYKYSSFSCSDRDYFFLGQLPYFTVAQSITYEVVTLLILMVHIFFPISFEGFRIHWKSWLNRLKIILLLIMAADLLVFGLYLSPVAFNHLPFRIAPYIRVVFFILSIRDLCNSIVVLVGMLPTYLNVLALWLLFLLFSSWLAFVIFEDTEQGKTIFTSYGRTLYQMFVLFTTSNNPDVWIPAYKASRWYSLFFVVYVLLGVYFVTNLILAVVYDSFKSELAKQVVQKDHLRTRILNKAFNLADSNNLGFLNKDQCVRLFEELNKYRLI